MPIHLFGCVCVLMAGQEQREGEALSEKISNFHMLVLFLLGKKVSNHKFIQLPFAYR